MDMQLLSEKVQKIQSLPEYESKEVIVQVIEALENFTKVERYSVFDNESIVWILKNYTIKELKEKATKALNKPEVVVGDTIMFGLFRDTQGVVLEVCGDAKDRLTVLFVEEFHLKIVEGVSCYDVKVVGHEEVDSMLKAVKCTKRG